MPKQICQICKKSFKRLGNHVKAHGLTFDQYLAEHDPAEHELREKIRLLDDLYITTRQKILKQFPEKGYRTIHIVPKHEQGEKAVRHWPLNQDDLREHLAGQNTLGVFFLPYSSKFIGFDIDIPPTGEPQGKSKAIKALQGLFYHLTEFVPPESILCSFSGNKGYHVDVFFDQLVSKDKLAHFYTMILDQTGYTESEIEVRGTGEQGYKLPLGYHQVTGGYCNLVTGYGEDIPPENELSTLQAIIKADPSLIEDATADYTQPTPEVIIRELKEIMSINPLEVTNPTRRIARIEREGIQKAGTRHDTARELANLYAVQGLNQAHIEEKLLQWHKTLDKQFYTSTAEQIEADCKQLAENAVKTGCLLYRFRTPIITKEEILKALTIRGKPRRRLYYAFLIHAKTFADRETGEFYFTYEQIGEALSKTAETVNRGHLRQQILRMADQGLIEPVRMGVIDPDSRRRTGTPRHYPNLYKLPQIELDPEQAGNFLVCNRNCSHCYLAAVNYHLSEVEQKKYFPLSRDRREIRESVCIYEENQR